MPVGGFAPRTRSFTSTQWQFVYLVCRPYLPLSTKKDLPSASTERQADYLCVMDHPVPTVESFDEIYPEDSKQSQSTRWNNLLDVFKKEYGSKADFVSRSPGRVNIIGEVGFPVCRS